MKQWIYVYTAIIIAMIALVWNSISGKIIPGITYSEMVLSGMIIVLFIYLPVLIKSAECEIYKVIKATFIPDKGWTIVGIVTDTDSKFFTNEDHVLDHFVKEEWQLKNVIGTEKERYYYLYRNWQ